MMKNFLLTCMLLLGLFCFNVGTGKYCSNGNCDRYK